MKNFKMIVPFLLVLLLAVPATYAQTTTTTTTLSVALTDTVTSTVVLASGTNVAANGFIFVDKELMAVVGAINSSTTRWTVRRGAGGTIGTHAAAAIVTVASPGRMAKEVFRQSAPSGTCTSANEAYLPIIIVPTGDEMNCSAGQWTSKAASRTVVYAQGPTVANAVTSQVFIADRAYVVTGIKGVWGVKETTGAMDVTPEKATGTTACGSGTALLSAVIDATGTANTVATGSLSATAASLHLAAGDRLCVKLSATPNEIANLVVTFTLAPK